MKEYIGVRETQLVILLVACIALLVDLFYYLKIKRYKNVAEFIRNLFVFGTKAFIKNLGVDDIRKKYLQVNNYCMIIVWLSLLLHFILLLALDKNLQ